MVDKTSMFTMSIIAYQQVWPYQEKLFFANDQEKHIRYKDFLHQLYPRLEEIISLCPWLEKKKHVDITIYQTYVQNECTCCAFPVCASYLLKHAYKTTTDSTLLPSLKCIVK
jgi:hypothetical protein